MNKRWSANIYVILSAALGYILSALVFPVVGGKITTAAEKNLLNILNVVVITLVPTAIFVMSGGGGIKNFSKKIPLKTVPLYLLAVPVLWSGAGYLNSQASGILKTFGIFPVEQLPASGELSSAVTGFIFVCIAAPIMEEIFYRGVVLHLLKGYGNGCAILISALIFAIAHGSITVFVLPFIYGLVLAYVTLKNESIFPAVIMHSLCNFISWLLMTFETGQTVNVLISVLSIILGAGGLVFAIIKIIKNRGNLLRVLWASREYFKNPTWLIILTNYIYTNTIYHG